MNGSSPDFEIDRIGGHAVRRRGFTLIEVLLAMAVMASLLTMLAPAFANIGKSAGVNGGGNLVANLISSARQNALSKNAMTALVVVTDSTIDPRNRLFTMLELPAHQSNTTAAQSSEWKQIAKWETLAPGVVVDNLQNWSSATQAITPAFPQLSYAGKRISGFQYLIFMPDGSTLGTTSATVQLVEGYMPKGSSTPVYTSKLKNGTPANYYKLTVLNTTGRVKIDRPSK